MRRLVIWRHGRTTWNAEHRFQGQSDVPLDAVGVEQARRAAVELAALKPSVIVSSDLQRARDTAAALAAVTGLEVNLDRRLRETYEKCIWINPVPEDEWEYTQSIPITRQLMEGNMYPLTLRGLEDGMAFLSK